MIRYYKAYEHSICISTTRRAHRISRAITSNYDTENYGFETSRESIERELNHRSFSVDFLFNI